MAKARPAKLDSAAGVVGWYHRTEEGLQTIERFAALSSFPSLGWLLGMTRFYSKQVAESLVAAPSDASELAVKFYKLRLDTALAQIRAKAEIEVHALHTARPTVKGKR